MLSRQLFLIGVSGFLGLALIHQWIHPLFSGQVALVN
jgi:hypothetical protein